MQTLEWFLERKGKKVFRNEVTCPCETCKMIPEEGITIRDEEHAQYLFDIQNDFGAEGIELDYRDEK